MPLLPTTLGSELAKMEPTDQEMEAIQAFADAYEKYMEGSMAGPVGAIPGSFAGAKSSMIGAMSGLSGDSAGAGAISSGIAAFWGVVAGAAASIWPPALAAVPPPGIGAVAAALTPAFTANTAGDLSLSDAANTVATAIHGTHAGGIANFPPPPAGIGPQPIT
jgi:hypothetical protein